MRRFFQNLVVGLVVLASVVGAGATLVPASAHAAACSQSGSFFGLPYWWRGLPTVTVTNQATKQTTCTIQFKITNNDFSPIWTIVVNLIDILLRLSGLVAVGFIIWGGIRYIMSQGNSSDMTLAKQTIVHAVVGLAIAISAVFILNFVAGTVMNLTVNKTTYQVSSIGGTRS